MNKFFTLIGISVFALLSVSCTSGPGGTTGLRSATDARVIEQKSRAALDGLYRSNPKALTLAKNAEAVLVFPEVVKGGFIAGGAGGDGALYQRDRATGYYRSISASWGLQAGLQKYSYALFLMDKQALANLNSSAGWEVGSSPNVTVLDKGKAISLTSSSLRKGTYAVFFDQKGLMAGVGLQGTKVTRLNIQP